VVNATAAPVGEVVVVVSGAGHDSAGASGVGVGVCGGFGLGVGDVAVLQATDITCAIAIANVE
jgi:hypothetical protein